MKPLVEPYINSVKKYVPGKPVEELQRELGISDVTKLASNENPLGASPKVRDAVRGAAERVHIYPDGAAFDLKRALCEFHDIDADQVATGAGSDELLMLSIDTFTSPGDKGVVSEYSFGSYPISLAGHGAEVVTVPVGEELEPDIAGMVAACDADTKMLFLANPNNPTGVCVGEQELRCLLAEAPDQVVVVVDEAYHDYIQADDYVSAVELRDLRDRLIVTRTFSKCYGLAGLRVGYAISTPEIVDCLDRIRKPFNVNSIAQLAAVAALEDREFVDRSVAVNERGRAQLEAGLAELAGLGVDWTPSQTNFLLVQMPVVGQKVYEAMLRRGVILRPMAGYGLPNCLRISIGTEAQNERCLTELTDVLESICAHQELA